MATSGGAVLFGVCAIGCAVKGDSVGLVIMGLIALCHMGTAHYYWRRYLAGRKRRHEREAKELDSRFRGNDILED